MKVPIAWHEECLRNTRNTLDLEELRIEKAQERFKSQWQEYVAYKDQIDRAKREGRDGFDAERYGVKRG